MKKLVDGTEKINLYLEFVLNYVSGSVTFEDVELEEVVGRGN